MQGIERQINVESANNSAAGIQKNIALMKPSVLPLAKLSPPVRRAIDIQFPRLIPPPRSGIFAAISRERAL